MSMLHLVQWMGKLVCFACAYMLWYDLCVIVIMLSLTPQNIIITVPIVISITVEDEDFAGGPFFVIFSTGLSLPAVVCTSLLTVDDTAVEGDQNFTIFIESIEPNGTISKVTPYVQTAVITDNDGIYTFMSCFCRFSYICTYYLYFLQKWLWGLYLIYTHLLKGTEKCSYLWR